MTVRMTGIFDIRGDLSDFLWIGAVAVFTTGFIWCYSSTVVNPLYDALQCSCTIEGENCLEAQKFSSEFWDNYWQHSVPNSFEEIDTLRSAKAASMQTIRTLARRAHHHIRSG